MLWDKKRPLSRIERGLSIKRRGGDLLYRKAVPSALQGLTSVFGMGTGGTPALQPPHRIVERASVFGWPVSVC